MTTPIDAKLFDDGKQMRVRKEFETDAGGKYTLEGSVVTYVREDGWKRVLRFKTAEQAEEYFMTEFDLWK